MNKNEIVQLADGIYQIKYYWLGTGDVYMYLVVGKKRALMIDSGYSTTHAKKYAETVTNLPIDVVSTHGHFDHIGGNSEFEKAYLSEKDWEVAGEYYDYEKLKKRFEHKRETDQEFHQALESPELQRELDESLHMDSCEYLPLPENGYFDLGDRKILILETPGHTRGCICLFDEKTKYLFGGDMICEEAVLLNFDHSTSVREYRDSVKLIKEFYESHDGKKIYPSHHQVPVETDIFDRYMDVCEKIISGELKGEYADIGIGQGMSVKCHRLEVIYNKIQDF